MITKKIITLALATGIALTTGCASRNASEYSSPLRPGDVTAHQLEADIAVGGKISGEASGTTILWLFSFGPDKFAEGVNYSVAGKNSALGGFFNFFSSFNSTNDIKNAAAYDAITKSSSDIIIAPKYILDVQNYFLWKEIHATVSGYKGTITKIEQRKPNCCIISK
ncbi:MAG: hypothetical protein GQ581_01640 [Methyloprofundus sp.]|nr:hypothetical protein [Methyloprofundus sp.]